MTTMLPAPEPRARGRAARPHPSELVRALGRGHHRRALALLRRLPRARGGDRAARLALLEAESLFALSRPREALGVVTRALRRAGGSRDDRARLRIARARGLWATGAPGRAGRELARAASEAEEPLTRARLVETQGFLDWSGGRPEPAWRRLAEAKAIYATSRHLPGVIRVLETEAELLREAGRFDAALEVHRRALESADALGRLDLRARIQCARGDLLAYLGRWDAAGRDLDAAAAAFRNAGDPRELTLAGPCRAVVELARGNLAGARAVLEQARELAGADRGEPRSLAEELMLRSDLELASGRAERAEKEAREALCVFQSLQDRDGECRARVRRVHALLERGSAAEAIREARNARRAASGRRPDLQVLAEIGLGRALLRAGDARAAAAFDAARERAATRPGLAAASRLGRALCRGEGRGDLGVEEALWALEAWGDRRIFAYALSDLRHLGRDAGRCAVPAIGVQTPVPEGPCPAPLVALDAAEALLGDGAAAARWAAALAAVSSIVPWRRAALVAGEGWLLRHDLETPQPLGPGDVARTVAARRPLPVVVGFKTDPALASHPDVALHDLGLGLAVPAGPEAWLYLDLGADRRPPGADALALVQGLGRLLAAHGIRPRALPAEVAAVRPTEIIGRSPAIEALLRRMERLARSDVTVHLFGETGTGKERIARAIHERSRRRAGPFVAVNASTPGDELFDAEMFGHARGAFTGAVAARPGRVAEAEGGTLFIDEVADLTHRAQAKLLRFLQEKEYTRIGEPGIRKADVRIVTASNAPLRERVQAGRFRADLMYRLDVAVLELPPLRERGEDVLLLTRHFLRRWARAEGLPAPVLTPEAVRAFLRYPWPGNVRELESLARCLVVEGAEGGVRLEQLPRAFRAGAERGTRPLREALLEFERQHLRRVLERHGGRRTRAAQDLGITRQALLAKIRRHGL